MKAFITSTGLKECHANNRFIRHFFLGLTILYAVMSLIYYLIGYKVEVPEYMEQSRVMLTIYYVIMLSSSFMQVKMRQLFVTNAIIFLVMTLMVKFSYYAADMPEFGHLAGSDAYFYFNTGTTNYELSIGEYISYLLSNGMKVDDLGYLTIVYLVHNILPYDYFTIYFIILINTILIYYSTVALYKLQYLFTKNDQLSKFTALLYGASPFMVTISSNGLKEIFFVFFVIHFFYHMYMYKQDNSLYHLAFMIVFGLMSLFFRTAVFYMQVLSLIVCMTANNSNKRLYMLFFFVVLFFVTVVANYLMQRFMGFTMEQMAEIVEYRAREQSDTGLVSIINWIAGIIGPLPNFDRPAAHAFTHNYFSFIKSCFSLFFILSVVEVIRKFVYQYYPIVVFITISIYMTVVAGVALDVRFHITYLPLFFILATQQLRRINPFVFYGYMALVVGFFIMYSTRAVTY